MNTKTVRSRPLTLLMAFLFVCMGASDSRSTGSTGSTGPVPGRFIVKFNPGVRTDILGKSLGAGKAMTPLSRALLRADLIGRGVFDNYFVIAGSDTSLTLDDLIDELGADNIESIEPDYYVEFFGFPSDSLAPNQWYLYNTGQSYLAIDRIDGFNNDSLTTRSGTSGKDIRMVNLYNNPPAETTKVVVAIIDSGSDIVHPELRGRYWRNPDEIADGIDNDHNGYVDDTLGYDISGDEFNLFQPEGDNDPTDSIGHGTHIAGIIAASVNDFGIQGIAPTAELMIVKNFPNAFSSVSAECIIYAVNAGAQIISISWGTPFESGVLRDALKFARSNGVFVCIAPGNTGSNERFFPAAFDSTFVVGAGNSDGFVTDFSTFGSHLDIIAPGLDILSLRAAGTDLYEDLGEPDVRIIDSLYFLSDGTSMATPMVAGAAAVLWSFRPDLSLSELEDALLSGADDLVDPWGLGDYMPGWDSISGHGYLNIDASLSLVASGGLRFVSPIRRNRYIDDVEIVAEPVGNYQGGYRLEYSVGVGGSDWKLLSQSTVIGEGTLIHLFSKPDVGGLVNLRLIDDNTRISETNFIYAANTKVHLTSPNEGDELKFSFPISGSVHGPGYQLMAIEFRQGNIGYQPLFSSTGEFFDSLLFKWIVSVDDTGEVMIRLTGFFSGVPVQDSVRIKITSAFASGWPQPQGGFGGITPVSADLNHDGQKEIIVTSNHGLLIYSPEGELLDSNVIRPDLDLRCVPAIYDVDGDGEDEIICTGDSAIHVFNMDGTYVDGWPVKCVTGVVSYQYGYPNPTVTQLGSDQDSAIVIINIKGQVLAYKFNGDPYFFSLGGLFASVGSGTFDASSYIGEVSPFVTSADLTGDGVHEVVVSFNSNHDGGIAIFDGRTGLPAFGADIPVQLTMRSANGATLADLDGDGLPEIIALGVEQMRVGENDVNRPHLWVKKYGNEDLPGWPVKMPELPDSLWIASYPIAADLDLDGIPEILVQFFSFDISYLYIFRADGTSYVTNEEQAVGRAFFAPVTMGTPTVANLTGDEYPEIIIRSGYLLPGTGPERVYVLNHRAELLPGFPIETPTSPSRVSSSRFAPLVDDFDSDGLMELALSSDGNQILVWDFDAPYDEDRGQGRFLYDNLNSGQLAPTANIPTSVESEPPVRPIAFDLQQNYPNPFNPVTTIVFTLTVSSRAKLELFNVLGQKVGTLVDAKMTAGTHRVRFDGSDLAGGLYFYRLRAEGRESVRKMVLLK